MKPKIFTSILLFISAYSPLFVILAVKDFDFDQSQWFKHPVPILILLGITAVSIILLFIIIKSFPRGNMRVEIISVRDRSVDVINYSIPYMISFFGIDLSRTSDVVAAAIFLLIMLLLTVTSNSVFLNPILALAGYQLFDIDYKFDGKRCSAIVMTNFELNRGKRYYILSLTKFLYFVTLEGDNENGI